jgi:hypothetical protein
MSDTAKPPAKSRWVEISRIEGLACIIVLLICCVDRSIVMRLPRFFDAMDGAPLPRISQFVKRSQDFFILSSFILPILASLTPFTRALVRPIYCLIHLALIGVAEYAVMQYAIIDIPASTLWHSP